MASAVVSAIKTTLGAIGRFFAGAGRWLYNSGRSLISGLVNGVKSMGSSLWNGIKGVSARIGQFFAGVGRWLFDSGRALIRGFIDGIKSMGDSVSNAASGTMQRVRNWFPFSPAKEGPFSGKGWTLYSGQALMEGLADGIKDASMLPQNALSGAMQSAKAPINQAQQVSQNSSTSIFGNVNIGSKQDADYFFERMNRSQQALGLGLAGGTQ
jgi:phage-related protein